MPKFYHHSGLLGFAYKARAVGFRRIFPLSLLPYLTGDMIQIHLSMKPLFKQNKWQTGILQIEPPEYSDKLWENGTRVVVSNNVFEVREWTKGKWWSETLSLKSGVRFSQPCNIECSLYFQNINDNKIEKTTPVRIADIEVVSRGPFLTQVCIGVFGLIGAGLIGYLIAILTKG